MEIFADGESLGQDNSDWRKATNFVIPGDTRVVSVEGRNTILDSGILGSFSNGLVTNESWKCSNIWSPGLNSPDFDDSQWSAAVVVAEHGASPWGDIKGIDLAAKWIWTSLSQGYDTAYCRLNLQ